ncbi:hypothetical protein [Actinoplanes siamensis]|uniref:Uncharacterized protein n=1 Tax=Actinoplanes siamensis TaxID=1223317 RepID=A0A919N8D0_9ACTN|nr:hypothetical protein [Actinoplanes siamensis]GIF06358.1 hypothetical protein Asi03nite_38960 [Actinoplanes siamensis]
MEKQHAAHGVHRPTWPDATCGTCDADWPCDPAVDALVADHGTGLPLSAALWRAFDEVARMLPGASFADLRWRCFGRPLAHVEAQLDEPLSCDHWSEVTA